MYAYAYKRSSIIATQDHCRSIKQIRGRERGAPEDERVSVVIQYPRCLLNGGQWRWNIIEKEVATGKVGE